MLICGVGVVIRGPTHVHSACANVWRQCSYSRVQIKLLTDLFFIENRNLGLIRNISVSSCYSLLKFEVITYVYRFDHVLIMYLYSSDIESKGTGSQAGLQEHEPHFWIFSTESKAQTDILSTRNPNQCRKRTICSFIYFEIYFSPTWFIFDPLFLCSVWVGNPFMVTMGLTAWSAT